MKPSSYEQSFATQFGPGFQAFSFWKGRVALYAILKALEVKAGDEVILPGYTCVVVPNAIKLLGAKPIYIDNAPGTYHIDINKIPPAITPKTKAILIQHTYGIPGPINEALEMGARSGIPVIEDSAHSLGSTVNGQKIGTFGIASFFSSQWSKPYTTGLGGIALTSDNLLAEKLSQIVATMDIPPFSARAKLWLQFQVFEKFYTPQIYWRAQSLLRLLSRFGLFVGSSSESELAGEKPLDHNWKMGNFQKVSGMKGLQKYIDFLKQRKEVTAYYDSELQKHGWELPYRTGDTIFLRYPVRVSNKEIILQKAKNERIEIGTWFETPLHPVSLSDHAIFDYQIGQCPLAEKDSEQIINLPLHEWINIKEASKIIKFFFHNAEMIY